MKPFLIIITGLPATGKTTLGRKMGEKFNIPFISKDDFKEIMFDTIGWNDREWSKKIGIASWNILYHIAEQNIKSGKAIILEANFDPVFASKRIEAIVNLYECHIVQIRCFSEGNILFKRFEERTLSEGRHPGHNDLGCLSEWGPILQKGILDPLKIEGDFLDINTTDINSIDYERVFSEINRFLELKKF